MILLLLFALVPACLGFSRCGGMSPGDMAHLLFLDADHNGDGILALGEMFFLFNDFDRNNDDRIGRWEFQLHINETEPELWEWYDLLFDTFDMDGDHWVELHDLVHLYLEMDPDNDNHVTEAAFIGYWSVLFQAMIDLHPDACSSTN